MDWKNALDPLVEEPLRALAWAEQREFGLRLQVWWEEIMRPLRQLYGARPDFDRWAQRFLEIAAEGYAGRSAELRALDQQRLLTPDWFQRSPMLGYIAYADRFAGDLRGVAEKIPYLQELDITYLHLMPLLKPRDGENDGGYAVADYRQVDPRLGSMADLADLARQLRAAGISLCTDLVCNHTATEHEWALKARAGDAWYQNYYLMFPDRTLPDQYERALREIFPEFKQGSFLYHADAGQWVWTTFHPYQWDLNYQNPAVFGEMLAIMLYLANQGIEVLRMDAVAFMWKELGTSCENLPQAHALLQAWRALTRLAAPGLLLKAEAIVAPEWVVPYLGRGEATNRECELAYHNSLMVLLWSALAERNVRLATYSLQQLPEIPSGAAWVTYVRCHDDIGWAVMDDNAAAVGLNGFQHRAFLSDFYSGQFPDSFARGALFQFNPATLDRRISGACASLAGLELAIEQQDWRAVDGAIGRILLLHSVIMAYGGIPLLYMGDEIGLLNDYNYVHDPEHQADSRWLNRPKMDWRFAEARYDPRSIPGRIFTGLQQLAGARRRTPALHPQAAVVPVWTHNDAVLGLLRHSPRGRLLILANDTEQPQTIAAHRLTQLGFGGQLRDELSGQLLAGWSGISLHPYQTLWLQAQPLP